MQIDRYYISSSFFFQACYVTIYANENVIAIFFRSSNLRYVDHRDLISTKSLYLSSDFVRLVYTLSSHINKAIFDIRNIIFFNVEKCFRLLAVLSVHII